MVAPEQVPVNRKPLNELHFAMRYAAPRQASPELSHLIPLLPSSYSVLRHFEPLPEQVRSALQDVIGHIACICFVPLKGLCSPDANQLLC
jgi:hypothetical protein